MLICGWSKANRIWQRFSDHSWYNMKDRERDWIFKIEGDDNETDN